MGDEQGVLSGLQWLHLSPQFHSLFHAHLAMDQRPHPAPRAAESQEGKAVAVTFPQWGLCDALSKGGQLWEPVRWLQVALPCLLDVGCC